MNCFFFVIVVMQVIANGFVETVNDALLYLSSTLLASIVSSSNDDNSQFKTNTMLENPTPKRRSLRLSQSKSCTLTNPTDHLSSKLEFREKMSNLLITSLNELEKQELIYIEPCIDLSHDQMTNDSKHECKYLCPKISLCALVRPTAFGRAVLSSSLGPVHGLVVFDELDKARRAIALDTELHLVYLV